MRQVATFVPRGLLGRVYWYAVAPFHGFVFPGVLAGLADEAERRARSEATEAASAHYVARP